MMDASKNTLRVDKSNKLGKVSLGEFSYFLFLCFYLCSHSRMPPLPVFLPLVGSYKLYRGSPICSPLEPFVWALLEPQEIFFNSLSVVCNLPGFESDVGFRGAAFSSGRSDLGVVGYVFSGLERIPAIAFSCFDN